MCPDWESNRWPFGSQACAQFTEPHQPEWLDNFSEVHPPFSVLGPQGMLPWVCLLSPGMTVVWARLSWLTLPLTTPGVKLHSLPAEFFIVFNNVLGQNCPTNGSNQIQTLREWGLDPQMYQRVLSVFSQPHPPSYNKAEPSILLSSLKLLVQKEFAGVAFCFVFQHPFSNRYSNILPNFMPAPHLWALEPKNERNKGCILFLFCLPLFFLKHQGQDLDWREGRGWTKGLQNNTTNL